MKRINHKVEFKQNVLDFRISSASLRTAIIKQLLQLRWMIIAVGTDKKSSITMNKRSKSHHNPPSSSFRADFFFSRSRKDFNFLLVPNHYAIFEAAKLRLRSLLCIRCPITLPLIILSKTLNISSYRQAPQTVSASSSSTRLFFSTRNVFQSGRLRVQIAKFLNFCNASTSLSWLFLHS